MGDGPSGDDGLVDGGVRHATRLRGRRDAPANTFDRAALLISWARSSWEPDESVQATFTCMRTRITGLHIELDDGPALVFSR